MREWLRDLRHQKHMTMKELGAKIGVSESTMCLLEQGKRRLTLDALIGIAQTTGEKIETLIELESSFLQSQKHSELTERR